MKKRILSSIILLGFLFCLTPITVQAAGVFLGDFCWSGDDGSDDTITCKLGLFHPGGGHFSILGIVEHGSDGTYVARGNLEIIGDKIHMSIVFADGNNNAMASTHVLCVLDPSTFNGSYNGVSTGANDTGKTEIDFVSGTLNFIPCQ